MTKTIYIHESKAVSKAHLGGSYDSMRTSGLVTQASDIGSEVGEDIRAAVNSQNVSGSGRLDATVERGCYNNQRKEMPIGNVSANKILSSARECLEQANDTSENIEVRRYAYNLSLEKATRAEILGNKEAPSLLSVLYRSSLPFAVDNQSKYHFWADVAKVLTVKNSWATTAAPDFGPRVAVEVRWIEQASSKTDWFDVKSLEGGKYFTAMRIAELEDWHATMERTGIIPEEMLTLGVTPDCTCVIL